MKAYVARAMQIACMSADQVQSLHNRECDIGRTIPNFDIQNMFGLSRIRTMHEIPDDLKAQEAHSLRIERDIRSAGLMKTGEFYEDDLEFIHAFDWNVQNGSSAVNWTYCGL